MTYGYHRARNALPSGDYSVVLPEDRLGDGNAASAIDMSFPPAKMKLYTQRLIDATARNDPRVKYLREFYGTTNGGNVVGRNHDGFNVDWEFATSDDTHLWHIHQSFFRKYSNSMEAVQAVYSVLTGGASPTPTPPVGDDDDMPMGIPPTELPKGNNTQVSYAIFPVNSGGLPWGPAYLNMGGDLFGGQAAFRVAYSAGDGKWAMLRDKLVVDSGKIFNTPLATGTRILSVTRVKVNDADACTGSVSMSIEYGKR